MGDTQRQRTLVGRQTGDQSIEAVRHPKQLGSGGSCSKIEGTMPHRASAPGLVPGQWARGRERNGVADGASGPGGQRGWGAADSTHFPPFPFHQTLFFFSFSF